jgi:hypothetical protein
MVSCQLSIVKGTNYYRCALEAMKMGEYKVYYIAKGPIRGPCEHKHRTIDYAYHCLRQDHKAAEKDGTLSDRRVYAVDNGHERELVEHEINQLDYARKMALKKTAFKQEQRTLNSEM